MWSINGHQIYALLTFVTTAHAIPWLEPVPTPEGAMIQVGFSPKPTAAPGFDDVPKELRRQNIPFPPPLNYCGFVGGVGTNSLTCPVGYCVYSGAALGCCGAGLIATCTNLFTSCVNRADTCSSSCLANPRILKCSDAISPGCGTYNFPSGARLYNCEAVKSSYTVQPVADFYYSSLGLVVNDGPLIITGFTQVIPSTVRTSYATTDASIVTSANSRSQSSVPLATTSSTSSSDSSAVGLAIGAIVGIVIAGVSFLVGIAVLIFVCCCLKRRRKRSAQQSQQFNQGSRDLGPSGPGVSAQQQGVFPEKPYDGTPYPQTSPQHMAPSPIPSPYPAPAAPVPASGVNHLSPTETSMPHQHGEPNMVPNGPGNAYADPRSSYNSPNSPGHANLPHHASEYHPYRGGN